MPKMVNKRSIIMQYFNKDIYLDLLKITMMSDIDNNEKRKFIKSLLFNNNIPFSGLGPGTNRMAVQIDGYAVKIALDKDGMVDNRREMLYTKQLQPFVIKVYECIPNGLIAVSEYVEIFTLNDFHKNREKMREILEAISEQYFIGDIGIITNNYINWGTRKNGDICILDFAYIYSVSFNIFTCPNDDNILRYDENYVNLICPECGEKYTFGDIRRRITREQQEKEIGDIRRLGYNLTLPEQQLEYVSKFEPVLDKKIKKKKELSEYDKAWKAYKAQKKAEKKDKW